MYTAFITGIIRQRVQERLLYSTRFASRFQQDLSGVYGFSQRRGTGIVKLTHPFLAENNVKGVTKPITKPYDSRKNIKTTKTYTKNRLIIEHPEIPLNNKKTFFIKPPDDGRY